MTAAQAARRSKFPATLGAVVALICAPAAAASKPFGPFGPANPYTAANGAATMHGDAESSDASPYPGPGIGGGGVHVQVTTLAAACPTLLQGSDGLPVALCTSILGRNPTVYLLDPSTGASLASLKLAAGNLFGGVYAYMDKHNRIVLFDAAGDLLRIGHAYVAGHWSLEIESSISTAKAIDARCASVCGGVVGLAPDWLGRVWFATTDGVAGYVNPSTRAVRTIVLGHGEQVANSISTAPQGVAIATDHALYLLDATRKGAPRIVWRYGYDRGPARKPGQLSWGTGSTPSFFGPRNGTRYLTITDNASPDEHLLVFDTEPRRGRLASKPDLVCKVPVLAPGPSGTENAPVGSGRSVFIASTYGYPYPALPAGAPPSVPATAPFTGGITRVDLNASGHGCHTVWQDTVRSAAVPRLDVPDGILYTVQRTDLLDPTGTSDLDAYSSVAIDAATGAVLHSTLIGAGYLSDTLQLALTIVPGRVMYQGTITGIDRISG